jgi:hypothetical protein
MIRAPAFKNTDTLLAMVTAILMVSALALAAEAHMLCSIYCLHGDHMVGSDICSSQP